jgi:hypothetical protein
MEAAGSYETLVFIYQTAWRRISKDSNLHGYNHENLKPHMNQTASGQVSELLCARR